MSAHVRTGTPAHRASAAVVWPLHSGVSRNKSASEVRAMYDACERRGVNTELRTGLCMGMWADVW